MVRGSKGADSRFKGLHGQGQQGGRFQIPKQGIRILGRVWVVKGVKFMWISGLDREWARMEIWNVATTKVTVLLIRISSVFGVWVLGTFKWTVQMIQSARNVKKWDTWRWIAKSLNSRKSRCLVLGYQDRGFTL
jgi:hypothetical protein